VCGWFKNEFDMFGAHMRPHDDRYKYATEWLDLVRRAWTEDAEFDFDSESFHARAVWSQPKPLQKPHPPIMNAGGSPAAQDFTTRYCDMNFVILKDRTFLEGAKKQIDNLKSMARAHGRETRIWIHVYVVCRETEKEAKDYLHHYVHEKGDREAAGNLLRIFGMQICPRPRRRRPQGAFHRQAAAGYPPVGTAEQIVDELGKLRRHGVATAACAPAPQERASAMERGRATAGWCMRHSWQAAGPFPPAEQTRSKAPARVAWRIDPWPKASDGGCTWA
jgi:alkanesulfonate monooxygenase SsuD/methylene tetrahydromethanopterin reductase-like flavin-dependent oxidoreductase (luciferase family)